MSGKPKNAARLRVNKAAKSGDDPQAAVAHGGISPETIFNAVAAHATAQAGNLDSHGLRVIGRLRLRDNKRLCEAFTAVTEFKPEKISELLIACVEADLIARKYNRLLADERHIIARVSKLKQNVEDLRQFLDEFSRPLAHQLAAWVNIPKEQDAAMRESLNEIAALVDLRHRVAQESMLRLGATRKARTNQAAETAAIGWVADAVEHIAGKPCTRHAATIAEIALGFDDTVSEDRAREARRTRQREWQVPGKLASSSR